jgi:hypothetical protein
LQFAVCSERDETAAGIETERQGSDFWYGFLGETVDGSTCFGYSFCGG